MCVENILGFNFRTVDYACVPSVQIIERLDNRNSDNREPTVPRSIHQCSVCGLEKFHILVIY